MANKITTNTKGKIGGVYLLKNSKNGRVYVGSSANIHSRFKKHLRKLRKGKHENLYLQNDYNKTQSDFKLIVLAEEMKPRKRLKIEQEFLDKWFDNQNICYNILPKVAPYGKVKTDKGLENIKKAASKTMKKLWQTEDFRKKHKQIMTSHEVKNKIIANNKKINSKEYNILLFDPQNNEVFLSKNLSEFARAHSLRKEELWSLVNKKTKICHGWTLDKKIQWTVTDGKNTHCIFEYQIPQFCEANAIGSRSHFKKMLLGQRKEYKGWRLS